MIDSMLIRIKNLKTHLGYVEVVRVSNRTLT